MFQRRRQNEYSTCFRWTWNSALKRMLMFNFKLKELLSSTKMSHAAIASSQSTHKNTKEKQKPPSDKPSYFSTVSSIGYTLGTASIPFLQNKAHWQCTHTYTFVYQIIPFWLSDFFAFLNI